MELDTVAKVVAAFYRLVGTESSDDALMANAEQVNEVAYTYLTRGSRNGQRWMLKAGWMGWQKSAALSWVLDSALGVYGADLPADFLRAFGTRKMSALRRTGGAQWGVEVDGGIYDTTGSVYQLAGDRILLGRTAVPPGDLVLLYHYTHPKWENLADEDIDFPVDARALIVAEAANVGKEEYWLTGGPEMEMKIERELTRAREEARDLCRQTKSTHQLRKATRFGNRW